MSLGTVSGSVGGRTARAAPTAGYKGAMSTRASHASSHAAILRSGVSLDVSGGSRSSFTLSPAPSPSEAESPLAESGLFDSCARGSKPSSIASLVFRRFTLARRLAPWLSGRVASRINTQRLSPCFHRRWSSRMRSSGSGGKRSGSLARRDVSARHWRTAATPPHPAERTMVTGSRTLPGGSCIESA
eukprot:3078984-Prymnesium_polylepis.1